PVPPPAPPAPAITTQPSDPTLDTHAQFKFTDADGAATFECRLDGAPFAACKSPTNYSGLAAGFHTFQVRAVNAGGTGEPTSYTWGILPPAPLLTSTPASPAVAIEASFAFTDGDPSATFECSLDGADFASCASPQAYAALAYGSHTFQVRAVNEVGAGPVTSYSWWILPPAPEFTGWPPNPSESTSATFSFEDGDPTATFECSLDGAPFAACTSPTTYVDLASGEHTFQVRARNGGGTSAAVSYTWTVDPLKVHMRLLVISGNGGEQYDFATNPYCSPSPCKGAIQTYLDELGIPYDTMIASQTDPATLADTLGLDGTTGNYEGVILASGNLGYFDSGNNFVSGFTAEEWQTLWDYEAKFRVRQVTSVTYPGGSPDTYGLNYAGATGDTVQATLTNSGKQVFSYLNASASITIENAWTYLGTVADASVTPLLTTGDGYVIASTNTYADGRENLAVTATNAPWLLHTQLLSYGLVNWVTRGVFLGERHVSVAVQVDDLLADDDIWNVANDNDTSGDTFRMTGADFLAALSWQNGVRALDTDLQSFRIEFAFNGDGAYGDPPPQADHLGTAYPPDTLSPAVVANQGNFSFVNHTYTHQNLDSTDYATSLTEIANDQTAAGLLGLSNYSDEPFIQPDISGLSNPAFWQAAWDSGIRYLISDTSRPGGGNPSPNAGFHVGDTGQQLLVVPRHPSNLFYNLQTPAQWVDEYNWYYWLGSPSDSAWKFWPEPQTYSQILDHESDVLLGYMLAWDIDPWMFHQPNLGLYDGSHSLLGDLLDQTFQKYLAVYNLPVLGPAMKDLGETMADRMAFDASGVSGTLVPCQSLTLSVAKTAAIPVTGVTAGTTETYGGQPISTISVTAGSPVTIPATCGS
ncbi:MAG TPA: hypothetical protein VNH40_05725, partial [Gaiellaceae bacterium]|nr:hypothetical protein [Gaiellaceae bacterium]